MKCSKLIGIVVLGIVLVAGMSIADITNDVSAAGALSATGKYAEAQAAYEKIIKDYPNASVDWLASVQNAIGMMLHGQKKYPEAIAALEKVGANYPAASVGILIGAQRVIGHTLKAQAYMLKDESLHKKALEVYEKTCRNYPAASAQSIADCHVSLAWAYVHDGRIADAMATFAKIAKNYPGISIDRLAYAQAMAGRYLAQLKKPQEANAALISAISYYGRINADKSKDIAETYNLIDFSVMSFDENKTALQNILRSIPATEANTSLLGRIKSEYEKLK